MPDFSKPALSTHSSPKFKNQSNLSTAGDAILYSISIPYQVCRDWCSEAGHSAEKYTLILESFLLDNHSLTLKKDASPRHKHWPAGPAHFSDRRTSSGQCILSFTGPYGPPRYMSGHQISNSAGPDDDKSQDVSFARAPAPHLGSFRADLLLQRDASVARVGVRHVNQTH